MTAKTSNENNSSPNRVELADLPPIPAKSLYLHVPFCLQKCRYCDFYSVAQASPDQLARFVDAVLREATIWQKFIQSTGTVFQTVFFGGGTPTVLPPDQMSRLLSGLRKRMPIAPDAEWTVEVNPATVDESYCRRLIAEGVNRLSIGAQSFIDNELALLGRIHPAQAVVRTVDAARAAGFDRLSLDLMYAIPGQTLESWQASLTHAVELGVEHLSCYCLTLESGTPLWRMIQNGELAEADEQTQLAYMKLTRAFLAAKGFAAYEISNYAVPGQECRHNLVYWRGQNYIGLGPAAASHISGHRWRNQAALEPYHQAINAHRLPVADSEVLTLQQRIGELAMLMLRTAEGIDCQQFANILGVDPLHIFAGALPELERMGLLAYSNNRIALTETGVCVADSVTANLIRLLD